MGTSRLMQQSKHKQNFKFVFENILIVTAFMFNSNPKINITICKLLMQFHKNISFIFFIKTMTEQLIIDILCFLWNISWVSINWKTITSAKIYLYFYRRVFEFEVLDDF